MKRCLGATSRPAPPSRPIARSYRFKCIGPHALCRRDASSNIVSVRSGLPWCKALPQTLLSASGASSLFILLQSTSALDTICRHRSVQQGSYCHKQKKSTARCFGENVKWTGTCLAGSCPASARTRGTSHKIPIPSDIQTRLRRDVTAGSQHSYRIPLCKTGGRSDCETLNNLCPETGHPDSAYRAFPQSFQL